MQRITLLEEDAATGGSHTWNGGRGQFQVSGTFDGVTVTLQILGPDLTTWLSVGTDAALTAAGVVNFDLPPGQIRAAISGGDTPEPVITAVAASL